MHKDISSGLYTTTKYIVVLYGIKVIAFIILLYFYFEEQHQINLDARIAIHDNIMGTIMLLSGVELITGFLKSERFNKTN
jgi:hypothetical protein